MKIFCIIGDERAYRSRSPAMFTTVLKRAGIPGAYVPFSVKPKDVSRAMQSLRVLNIAGANVTAPYKETVVPHMDVLSEGANIIGAINTVVVKGDELKGYNTNAIGFMDSLREANFDAEGKSALVLGTGGAARAIAFILNWMRTDTIFVTGRGLDKTNRIVSQFGGQAIPFTELGERPLPVSIIVNTTAVSSSSESPEFAALSQGLQAPDCELVVDLNYGREKNFWQELALRLDVPFMDGLTPLAYQARRTFQLWTNQQIPPEEFMNALKGPEG
ncbi:MAG: hypothetical protein GY859_27190 [Desulfobacterales bacterium]|nr:hypothetical protein [Desulfobacterales bacterium]